MDKYKQMLIERRLKLLEKSIYDINRYLLGEDIKEEYKSELGKVEGKHDKLRKPIYYG